MVTFLYERFRPGSGKVLLPLAILVSIAVVLVKQHYILDMVAGILVGWGVYRLVFSTSYPLTTRAV
jgi:membrane-associated phospholipid phosphatase